MELDKIFNSRNCLSFIKDLKSYCSGKESKKHFINIFIIQREFEFLITEVNSAQYILESNKKDSLRNIFSNLKTGPITP